jgi:hypothetical protein
MKTPELVMVGYWFEKGGDETLPKPVAREKPWKGRRDFLAALAEVEAIATKNHYRGFSLCRVCECRNGTADFRLAKKHGNFVWPSGFAHYVKAHNVKPPQAFIDFVMRYGKT